MTGGYALSYREAASDVTSAGAKAGALGRLAAAGFRVPGGFVLSSAAYDEFAHASGVERLVRAFARAHPDPYREEALLALDRIRFQCRRTPMPDGIRAIIAGSVAQTGLFGAPLAVRSSAAGEDSAAASFAGIYRTLLNVLGLDSLDDAIRACWASLWTARAVAYRHAAGLSDRDVGMAVIIQRLVRADAAGVAFTRNPLNDADEVLIQSGWGLGEGVASSGIQPDSFVFRSADGELRLARAEVGAKERAVRAAITGGTTWQETPREHRSGPTLSPEQALAIAETARRIERALGTPQDIEWARVGDEVHIVQARPITTSGGVGSRRNGRVGVCGNQTGTSPTLPHSHTPTPPWGDNVWSTANLAEVLPRLPSPLTWSLSHLLLESGFRRVLSALGYRVPEGFGLSRRFQGRPYFNVAALQWLFWDAVGVPPEETSRGMGGDPAVVRVPPGSPFAGRQGLVRRRRRLRLALASLAAARRMPGRLRAPGALAGRLGEGSLARRTDLDLLEFLFAGADAVDVFFPEFLRVTVLASGSLSLLERLLTPRHGTAAAGLATALVAGAGQMASAEQGYLLERVAAAAAADPAARRFFMELLERSCRPEGASASVPAPDWRAALAGTRAGELFGHFLERFGHRAVLETEIAQPRWREDTTYPLEAVAGFLQSGASPLADPLARAQEARARAEARLGMADRVRLRWLARAARLGGRLRENAKSALVGLLAAHRRVILEVGDRMARRRMIERPDDVFFLRAEEIRLFLLGEALPHDLRAVVAARKEQRARAEAAAHPDAIRGDEWPETPHVAPRAGAGDPAGAPTPVAVGATARSLSGLAVSAGQATGPARILRDPSEGTRLRPGDILVARTADPAWTPLFLRAAAIVMETGGLLSHAAIVAREYGRPAVANVPGATELIAEGASVVVDGSSGRIEVLSG
ncbi:MAG: hypothetical protein HY321_19385 [Armatimonadetes bacterium]|nr:hypothetical protein [Armatimonadota bacterium]